MSEPIISRPPPEPSKPLVTRDAPQRAPAPASPFDPRKYLDKYVQAQQQKQAEAQVALEKAVAEDTAKYSGYVGKKFMKKNHGLPRYVFQIKEFVPRMHMGVLGNRAAFFVERLVPYEGSHFADCEEFLRDYYQV